MSKEKRFLDAMRLGVIALFVACITWGCTASPIELYSVDMTIPALEDDWSQVIDGVAVPLASLDDCTTIEAGETLVLERTLTQVDDEAVLMFLTKHSEVCVYIDDILVYEFAMQEGFAFLQTPGNEWHQVFFTEADKGATLRIELTSQFSYYSNLLYPVYLLHYSQMLSVQLQWLWLRLATGVFLLVIALISYGNGKLWKGTTTRRYVMLLADFYMVLALWVFANNGSFDVILRRPVVSYLIEMLALRLVPVVAYLFVCNILSRPYRLVQWIGVLVYAQFIASVLLQFIFGVSFLDTLWMVHALLIVGALVDFYIIAQHLYRTRYTKNERNYLFVCTGLLFASAIGEVWRFYAIPAQDIFISLYIAVGYVGYTLIAHIVLVHRNAGLDRSKATLQTHYNTLKNTTLMRQINAHFFFNILNTISALCKENALKADEAVTLFAKYMRHYMYFVNMEKNILFENELDLIRIYLSLEEMRFEKDFSATLDINFTDFYLPPLTVQPIVENAILHGVRQSDRFGKLTITSKKQGGYAVVMVQDNGVGFDMAILKEKESLAIENVRTRLASMAQGRMEIESAIGRGTKITILVPLANNQA